MEKNENSSWYLIVDEKESGPYSTDEIRQGLLSGRFRSSYQAVPAGGTEWQTLASFHELQINVDEKWIVARKSPAGGNPVQRGPFTGAIVSEMLSRGDLEAGDAVWAPGMNSWGRLADFEEFREAAGSAIPGGGADEEVSLNSAEEMPLDVSANEEITGKVDKDIVAEAAASEGVDPVSTGTKTDVIPKQKRGFGMLWRVARILVIMGVMSAGAWYLWFYYVFPNFIDIDVDTKVAKVDKKDVPQKNGKPAPPKQEEPKKVTDPSEEGFFPGADKSAKDDAASRIQVESKTGAPDAGGKGSPAALAARAAKNGPKVTRGGEAGKVQPPKPGASNVPSVSAQPEINYSLTNLETRKPVLVLAIDGQEEQKPFKVSVNGEVGNVYKKKSYYLHRKFIYAGTGEQKFNLAKGKNKIPLGRYTIILEVADVVKTESVVLGKLTPKYEKRLKRHAQKLVKSRKSEIKMLMKAAGKIEALMGTLDRNYAKFKKSKSIKGWNRNSDKWKSGLKYYNKKYFKKISDKNRNKYCYPNMYFRISFASDRLLNLSQAYDKAVRGSPDDLMNSRKGKLQEWLVTFRKQLDAELKKM